MNQKKGRILIVDDDKGICMILSDLMKKEGFETRTVYDGEKALKTIQSESPDLLLVDMMLPGMDGMEVLKRTRELDQELPVVFITAHADSRGAVKAPTTTAGGAPPRPRLLNSRRAAQMPGKGNCR